MMMGKGKGGRIPPDEIFGVGLVLSDDVCVADYGYDACPVWRGGMF